MSELLTITFDPRETCNIRLDHYMDLVRKADDYEALIEMIRAYVEMKGEETKWSS